MDAPFARPSVTMPTTYTHGGSMARRVETLRELGIDVNRMAGFLHKRNCAHFPGRFRRRWFTLKRGALQWFAAPGDKEPLGVVELSAHVDLVAMASTPCRFALHSSVGANGALELCAPDATARDMWLAALQTVIDELSSSNPLKGAEDAQPKAGDVACVGAWLESLRIPEDIAIRFEAAGYTDLGSILEMGLDDSDLDYIGVAQPLHRRLLRCAVAEGAFSNELRAHTVDYRICGTVALYAVTSRYKFRRSTLHLRYSNFVTLYAKLRTVARAEGLERVALPRLPGTRVFVDQKGPQFLERRRAELDQYLQNTVAVAATNDSVHAALLAFLQLADAPRRAANDERVSASSQPSEPAAADANNAHAEQQSLSSPSPTGDRVRGITRATSDERGRLQTDAHHPREQPIFVGRVVTLGKKPAKAPPSADLTSHAA